MASAAHMLGMKTHLQGLGKAFLLWPTTSQAVSPHPALTGPHPMSTLCLAPRLPASALLSYFSHRWRVLTS